TILGLSLLGLWVATPDLAPTFTFSLARPIRNLKEPLPPTVEVAPYTHSRTSLAFQVTTSVKKGKVLALSYQIGGAQENGALGAVLATGASDLPTPDAAITFRILHTGLALTHAGRYVIAVFARGDADSPADPLDDRWSPAGLSRVLLVDTQPPRLPNTPPTIRTGKRQLLLAWDPGNALSGIVAYRVERRFAHKPKWELVAIQPAGTPHKSPQSKAPALMPGGTRLVPEPSLVPYLSATSVLIPFELTLAGTVYYRLQAVNGAGEVSAYSPIAKVVLNLDGLPGVINQLANYPNPFDSRTQSTTIVYLLDRDVQLTLQLFDLTGRLVRDWTFPAGAPGAQAGTNELVWDGANGLGEKVATGVYLLVMRAHGVDPLVEGTRVVRKIGVFH
ncbi:MAG: FlgD immunoglobulin-like domain containing protein, partial [Dehalococcoidia bacterium]